MEDNETIDEMVVAEMERLKTKKEEKEQKRRDRRLHRYVKKAAKARLRDAEKRSRKKIRLEQKKRRLAASKRGENDKSIIIALCLLVGLLFLLYKKLS